MKLSDVAQAASEAAYKEDRNQVVGYDSYHGWVYRDAEDEGNISNLIHVMQVSADGIAEYDQEEFEALIKKGE